MLIPLLLFCISTCITPGPNNFMIMASGTNFGIRRSLPHFMGICIGFPAMLLIVGLGLASVFSAYPMLYNVIKIAGALYMTYMAYKIITATSNVSTNDHATPISFMQAVLFQWVNPKAWVMAIAAVSTYTIQNNDMLSQILLISFVFFITLFPTIGIWLFGGTFIRKIINSPRQLKIFNLCLGAALILSIVFIFI